MTHSLCVCVRVSAIVRIIVVALIFLMCDYTVKMLKDPVFFRNVLICGLVQVRKHLGRVADTPRVAQSVAKLDAFERI